MQDIVCLNCYMKGHVFKDCFYPVTSYGIIAFKVVNGEILFLLVQRKNSIGYIDFIRGRYNSVMDIPILVGEMTTCEKIKILNTSFDDLWKDLWLGSTSFHKNGYSAAKEKWNNLDVEAIMIEGIRYSKYTDEEWSIPKGRRNNHESNRHCATREFVEETGYYPHEFDIISDVPISETFYGSNGIPYKHTYYIAEIKTDRATTVDYKKVLQAGEIKRVSWLNYNDAMNIFRDYEVTRRNILLFANKFLLKYLNH